ncbi:helix-turn-helix domain-containing protein [Alkalihalobacterium alkalinitrilicum]|uniref:helix-turn-helix domain-containing protein n=1 Tax=Alkalihalobacterium alkalinitrilicum TaxID=427920 RepID=UPI000995CAB8|nr:XRE family transcriptional regulator [Alkalihalobacterium alkalinitrilicum]
MSKLNLNEIIGKRLKQIRAERGLSLDKLAQITEVSKPMLGQIERGESNPTVSTLWKIANGLKVPFTTFIEEETPFIQIVSRQEVEPLIEEKGVVQVYPLFPKEYQKPFEIFSLILQPGCHHESDPHAYGVEEYILVEKGKMEIGVVEEKFSICTGEGIRFSAHYKHRYINKGVEDAIATMIIFYAI